METEKTPQFTIIVADKPEEEALASIDSSSSSKAAKKQAEAKHAAEVQERIKSIKAGQEKVYPVDVQSLYEVSNPTLRTKLIAAVLDACRGEIMQRTDAVIKEKYGRSRYAIAEDCGMDQTALARTLNRRFYLPMDSCEKFCYKYLNKSIHELFFGVSKATPLPRHLNFLGQELDRLSDAGSDGAYELCSLYILCKEIFDRDENKFQNSLDTPVVEGAAFAICRERLYEMADEVFSIPEEGAGRVLSSNVRAWIRKIQYSEEANGTTFAIMHLAIEYQTTMDYLLVRNYTQVGDICYRCEDGSEVIIRDRYARDIFSMILQMSEKARTEFICQAWYRLLFK